MITTLKPRNSTFAAIALAALLAVLCFGMVACQPSSEQIIREGVTKEFEGLKTLDPETIEQSLSGISEESGLAELGVDDETFFRTWLEGFDYSIDNIAVEGDNATVTVTVTCKSLIPDALSILSEKLEAKTNSGEVTTQEQLNEIVGPTLLESIHEAPMRTSTIELPYVLQDKTWVAGPGFQEALAQGFVGETN